MGIDQDCKGSGYVCEGVTEEDIDAFCPVCNTEAPIVFDTHGIAWFLPHSADEADEYDFDNSADHRELDPT